jgi:hypothetical protein
MKIDQTNSTNEKELIQLFYKSIGLVKEKVFIIRIDFYN